MRQNIIDTQENVSYTAASKKEVLIKKHFCLPLPALTCVIENENGLEVRFHVHADSFAKDILLEIEGSDAQWSDNYFDLDAGAPKKDSRRKS
jgi:hypothetical protein